MKLLTGSTGFLGSHILNCIKSKNLFHPSKIDVDLLDFDSVYHMFKDMQFDTVIHTASIVGGLGAHKNRHSDFFYNNNTINLNIIRCCQIYKVKKLIAISSVAAFPENLQKLKEDEIYNGDVHSSEMGYGLSKRIMDEYIQLLRKEGFTNYCCVFPVNIYGPNDNFDLETGHCVASLIHKIYISKKYNIDLNVWGDGLSLRQFIYVKDLANIIKKLINMDNVPDRLIVGNNEVFSISEVVKIISKELDYSGDIIYDKSKPNGLRSRECDFFKMLSYSLRCETNFEQGIKETCDWFKLNYTGIKK